MTEVVEWFRANPDVFGFCVAATIFIITILLVTFGRIQFWLTLTLLLFSLVVGIAITNQHRLFDQSPSSPPQAEESVTG